MMWHLVVFCVLLFDLRYTGVQAQTAIWKFPTQGKVLEANTIDTVLLDWTSTLPSTILRMWCQNKTNEGSFALASSFYVDSAGPFKYVMETFETKEMEFPLSCHAELAAEPAGSGFDSPAGIIWSSNSAQVPKTISQTQAASSVTVTVVSTPSPSSTPTSKNTSPSRASSTGSITTDTPIPGTTQPITVSTKSPESPSGATTASQSSSASSVPSNTGAIIGGAIGGLALLSFIILALLFLRKYQRDNASSSPIVAKPSKQGFYLFNVYKKRGAKAHTTGVFEKEGDYGLPQGGLVQEKEGSSVSQVHEVQGSAASRTTMSRTEGDDRIRYSPVELSSDANSLP